MEVDKGRYTVAYECYKARILYGFYAYGDSLPTILTISKLFRIAPSTARAALALLEDEGYIKIEGKNRPVLFIRLILTSIVKMLPGILFPVRQASEI